MLKPQVGHDPVNEPLKANAGKSRPFLEPRRFSYACIVLAVLDYFVGTPVFSPNNFAFADPIVRLTVEAPIAY